MPGPSFGRVTGFSDGGAVVRVLFVGPGHNSTFRAWIAPFLGRLEARLVTTEPVPAEFAAAHPALAIDLLPRPALRRLPRSLFLHTLDYLLEIRERLIRFRPDLIHLHYASQLDALALASLPRGAPPLVITVYGADVLEEQIRRPLPLDLLVRRLFARAAAVTVKSPFLADCCRALGASPDRLHLVPWGLDATRFRPAPREDARAALGLPPGPLLLSPRSLHPLYGHELVLEAAQRLDPRPTVVFLGERDRRYAAALRRRCAALGAPARFLPELPADGMATALAAADAVVSIPASDGLPQTLLEAAACERATVTLDLPAYRDLPFAPDALIRVPQVGGRVEVADLARGLAAALAPGPRPGLAAAHRWVARELRFEDSVARVWELYRALAP